MNERELLAKKAALVSQARGMLETTETEKREFSAEEQANYDAIFAEIEKIDVRVNNLRRLGAIDVDGLVGEPVKPEGNAGRNPDEEKRAKAWSSFLRTGAMNPELRALQADSDEAGGYYTAPQLWVNRLIKAIDDQVWIRQWATKNTVANAQSLGVPTLAANPADADWTSELGVGDADTTMTFGKRELFPVPLAKLLKVSKKLLRLTPDVDSLVIDRLAYKFAVSFEKACMTGTGTAQPLGVFVASDNGISTSRDVSTGNAQTSIQSDGLKEAKYTLKAGYWPRAKWLFHRDAVKQIAKLQNDQGNYLWQPSIQMGQPDMLEGIPVFTSEYAPNTFTTGKYVGMIGDFSFFWIADALDFSIQRLEELYAGTNQTGFIGRMESDGMPVLAEAFVRVKLA